LLTASAVGESEDAGSAASAGAAAPAFAIGLCTRLGGSSTCGTTGCGFSSAGPGGSNAWNGWLLTDRLRPIVDTSAYRFTDLAKGQ
jgi:hypothetical protein